MLRRCLFATLIALLTGVSSLVRALELAGTNDTIRTEESSISLGAKHHIHGKVTVLSVVCRLSDSVKLQSPEITWERSDGSNQTVKTAGNMKISEYTLNEERSYESKLTVENTIGFNANYSGYKCIGKSGNQTKRTTVGFLSVPLLYIELSSSNKKYVNFEPSMLNKLPDLLVEFDIPLNITCNAAGYPYSTILWYREDSDGEEIDCGSCTFRNVLVFPKTSYAKDRSYYVCKAQNALGSSSLEIYLRVKNPKAYLVPLIVLSCLVVIVVAIYILSDILKKKQKRHHESDEEKDFDQSPQAVQVEQVPQVPLVARASSVKA